MSAKGKKEGVIEEEREKRVNPVAYALKGIREQDCLATTLCILLRKGKADEPVSGSKEVCCGKDMSVETRYPHT